MRAKASMVATAKKRRTQIVEAKQAANTASDKTMPSVADDAVSLTDATAKTAASKKPSQGRPSRASARQAGQTSKGRASADRLASIRSASLALFPITAR